VVNYAQTQTTVPICRAAGTSCLRGLLMTNEVHSAYKRKRLNADEMMDRVV
jgi:hypothetical protein